MGGLTALQYINSGQYMVAYRSGHNGVVLKTIVSETTRGFESYRHRHYVPVVELAYT